MRPTHQQLFFPIRPVTVFRQHGLDEPVLALGQAPDILELVFTRKDVAKEGTCLLMRVVAAREGCV